MSHELLSDDGDGVADVWIPWSSVRNVEVLVQLTLRKLVATKSLNLPDAKRLLGTLRMLIQTGNLSELFTVAEVDGASQQCLKLFQRNEAAMQAAQINGVKVLVKFLLQRFEGVSAVAKFFYMLHETGVDVDQFFIKQDLVEARARCAAHFDELASARVVRTGRCCSSKKSGEGVNFVNVGLVMQHVLLTCDSMDRAEPLFNSLRKRAGHLDTRTGGRGFSEEDIVVAWLRSAVCYDEQEMQTLAHDFDSGSEADDEPRMRRGISNGKKSRSEKPKRKQGGQRALGNEDSEASGEDLSGEEEVDDVEEDKVNRAQLLKDLGVKADAEEENADGYQGDAWIRMRPDVLPGRAGFNSRAIAVMRKVRVGVQRLAETFDDTANCPPLQPYQEAVAFLLHPKSPVSRLLVDHPTGSGKTREMIRVLDNHFYDHRPKIPIFPKESVCRNFYTELLRWPNRYRDYFCCMRPKDAASASGCADWASRRDHMWDLASCRQVEVRRLCESLREILEMKGMSYMGQMRKSFRIAFRRRFPGEPMPLAPLRAISYASAGGAYSNFVGGRFADQPASALMKVGYLQGSGNVYSNKVVLLDEAHNLVRTQTRYAEQLRRLRELLTSAERLVLAGFTGTPILEEPKEGRWLLDIIKGSGAAACDEGFISSFPGRPRPLFPEPLPRGLPDGLLTEPRLKQLVQTVELCGEALRAYEVKRRLGFEGQRLRNYCNVSVYWSSFHDGKSGSKAKILAHPEDCCPKLYAVAQDVALAPEKSLVLTGRTSGHVVMLELLRQVAAESQTPFGVATIDELAEFNHVSNLRGEKFRVLVADTAQCAEGVSFLAVRRTFLLDVPESPSQFVQQCGRSIRMFGHRGLPTEEQTVLIQLYVATFPKWMRSSLTCWAVTAQRRHGSSTEVERRACLLTARFKRSGIGSVAELKSAIGAFAPKDCQSSLSTEVVISFFEKLELWEEVRLLRTAAEKDAERIKKEKSQRVLAMADAVRIVKAVCQEIDSAGAPERKTAWKGKLRDGLMKPRDSEPVNTALLAAAPALAAWWDEEDKEPQMALALAEVKALAVELARTRSRNEPPVPKDHPLVSALRALHVTDSVDDAALSAETADETALRRLVGRTRDFVSALAVLRASAIDRELYAHCAGTIDDGLMRVRMPGKGPASRGLKARMELPAPDSRAVKRPAPAPADGRQVQRRRQRRAGA